LAYPPALTRQLRIEASVCDKNIKVGDVRSGRGRACLSQLESHGLSLDPPMSWV
jgi:hypothetical protein